MQQKKSSAGCEHTTAGDVHARESNVVFNIFMGMDKGQEEASIKYANINILHISSKYPHT